MRGPVVGRLLILGEEYLDNYPHCCEQMAFHIQHKERIVRFLITLREYSFKVTDTVGQQLNFCPWCGVQLPKSLRDTWCNILIDEYHVDSPWDDQIPSEFKTDEWWKKRGL